eukprot:TRINITY_DN2756_c0_g1::TRINITY_DN2756_c0_g1_i1::g.27823::m.27823 TRINITY_DN2756_c0_g1::TRINITY_DN2756_c0_g1_i1::g.27823  ORF type:complete len:123 (+),score=-10.09,Vpu/PF00558.14/1.2,Vpu/PF00558.14/99 TRINITY_DN2756_c0_g1_i1:156-524(+)
MCADGMCRTLHWSILNFAATLVFFVCAWLLVLAACGGKSRQEHIISFIVITIGERREHRRIWIRLFRWGGGEGGTSFSSSAQRAIGAEQPDVLVILLILSLIVLWIRWKSIERTNSTYPHNS